MTVELPVKPLRTVVNLDDIAQSNRKTSGQSACARQGGA